MKRFKASVAALIGLITAPGIAEARGKVVDAELKSRALAGNLVGLDTKRRIKVYLPEGYERSSERYPVVYWFHNMFWSPDKLFGENHLNDFIEKAIERRQLGKVIVVAGDFSTPSGINVFGNDRVAGRWIDHIVDELVTFADANYRTRATPASRGATGDFFGGYAALKTAMLRPGVFGSVYAMHPVGTGTGLQPGYWRPNWKLVHEARDWEDLRRDTYAPIFVAFGQAYLPNPSRPPFYCDFMVEPDASAGGELRPHTRNIITQYSRFLLDQVLQQHAESLKTLRALKIDWGRYDPTAGHVYSNEALSRKLDEYGVPHFSEEYAGGAWDKMWTSQGRVEADVLPFFAAYLEGAAP